VARTYGSDSSIFQTLTTQITDPSGVTVVDTGNSFGSSPMGVALREQSQFGLPNASFSLLPPDPSVPIEEYTNPLPYWQIQTTSNIVATSVFDSTTQTWGIKIDPGTAPSGDYITLKTRSWVNTDDNLALRQKASLTMAKNGTYAGASQWNLTLTAVYYDYTNTALGTTVIGTVYDNTTWTSISGTTTTGGSAIPASASWAEFTVTLTTTATVSSSTSVTLQSLLLATSNPMTGSFLIADSFTASGTWTRPTGVNFVTVVAVGGGGGGSSGAVAGNYIVDFNAGGGAGGGSSSWAILRDLYVGGDTTISVGIGTAGVGGAGTIFTKAAAATTTYNIAKVSGGAGGATTFGTYLTMPGGGGGATAGGTAGGAPTSGLYGLAFLGAVAGTAQSSGTVVANGNAGSASTYTQLPGWSAAFSAGAAGTSATTTSSAGGTLFAGTGAAAGSAGIIGSSGGGGACYISTAPLTPSITGAGTGGYGAGGSGGASLARITATSTVVVTGGNGGAGAANSGAGGGGGGATLVSASSSGNYNASTITFTAGSGGNGSAGRLYVIYTA